MANYQTPGVYVEEISTGARPIEAVGTSTAGFIGIAPGLNAPVDDPVPIGNFAQFARRFMDGASATSPLAQAVAGFFQNGGSRCYVVNIGAQKSIVGKGLERMGAIDEIAMIAAPGYTDPASYDALLSAAETLGDRIALLDGPEKVDDVEVLTRVATLDGDGNGGSGKKAAAPDKPGQRARASERGYGAFYFPWIRATNLFDRDSYVSVPPSGHIAGICARLDSERGVHKAPANAIVRGALGLTQVLSKAEQGVLNPLGVNCLRSFAGEGVMIWGARTLASSPEWRYLNVRRLFNMIEESIEKSTRWVVFEPNDRSLWKRIEFDLSTFLRRLWSQGALMGATPEQAFFVKCDEETNPPEVIDAGEVVTLIGIAPVKPAEFVIFRLGQSAAGAAVEPA